MKRDTRGESAAIREVVENMKRVHPHGHPLRSPHARKRIRRTIVSQHYVQRHEATLPNGASHTGSAILLTLDCGHVAVMSPTFTYAGSVNCFQCEQEAT